MPVVSITLLHEMSGATSTGKLSLRHSVLLVFLVLRVVSCCLTQNSESLSERFLGCCHWTNGIQPIRCACYFRALRGVHGPPRARRRRRDVEEARRESSLQTLVSFGESFHKDTQECHHLLRNLAHHSRRRNTLQRNPRLHHWKQKSYKFGILFRGR